MNRQFLVADVFTTTLFNGAQVAVFPDAQGLDGPARQQISAELNLWATVFVEARGRRHFFVHTYTPRGESDFGSHTAVAAATALCDAGLVEPVERGEALVFESTQGEVAIFLERGQDGFLMTRLAEVVDRRADVFVPERTELAALLRIDQRSLDMRPFRPLFVNVKRNYLIVPVRHYADVRKAVFDPGVWSTSQALSMATAEILLFCDHSESSNAEFHARLLAPHIGLHDDPPVGSAIPAFVSYLCSHDHVRRGTQTFTVERGHPSARVSRIEVEMDHKGLDQITMRVGGRAVISIRGEINT